MESRDIIHLQQWVESFQFLVIKDLSIKLLDELGMLSFQYLCSHIPAGWVRRSKLLISKAIFFWKLDGKDVRLADYFDVISGTSTGGLVSTLLTAPNQKNHPLFAAKEIQSFYLEHGPKIFPQPRVVQVKNLPNFDALLADICIGTTAAPTYFPAHYFKTKDSSRKVREFNPIDGGGAANNPVPFSFFLFDLGTVTCQYDDNQDHQPPTTVVVGEIKRQNLRDGSEFSSVKLMVYGKFLVISIGTGAPKHDFMYDAQRASMFGAFEWLTSGGSSKWRYNGLLHVGSTQMNLRCFHFNTYTAIFRQEYGFTTILAIFCRYEQPTTSSLRELVTGLSIDGCVIRGTISGVILAFLESELQVTKQKHPYFQAKQTSEFSYPLHQFKLEKLWSLLL
ncbi:hypothetical protein RJ641_032219 [Dillenia turbinata]|uniref:Patatin n=1 Tax=Dillenia turbinata TaxID=194707 RepID=A0AAN8VZL8_9MAGN